MLRREFLKFLGVVGAVAAVPTTASDLIELEVLKPQPKLRRAPLPPDTGLTFSFNFDGYWVDLVANEGSFTWTENRSEEMQIERGVLSSIRRGESIIDFELDCFVSYLSDHDFVSKVKSITKFDLTVTYPSGASVSLKDCMYTTLSWNMSQGAFEIRGVSQYV